MTTTPWFGRRTRIALAAALSVATAAVPAAVRPATAAPVAAAGAGGAGIAADVRGAGVTEVQNRRAYRRGVRRGSRPVYRRGVRRPPPGVYRPVRPRYGPVYRYPYRYRGPDYAGAALAAGIIGLAAGAIAGSALAKPRRRVIIETPAGYPAPYTAGWYRMCDEKYRSFRASDGTYLGYDGKRHVCRLP